MRITTNALVASTTLDTVGCPGVIIVRCTHCGHLTLRHNNFLDGELSLTVVANEMRKHASVCESWPTSPSDGKRPKDVQVPGQINIEI